MLLIFCICANVQCNAYGNLAFDAIRFDWPRLRPHHSRRFKYCVDVAVHSLRSTGCNGKVQPNAWPAHKMPRIKRNTIDRIYLPDSIRPKMPEPMRERRTKTKHSLLIQRANTQLTRENEIEWIQKKEAQRTWIKWIILQYIMIIVSWSSKRSVRMISKWDASFWRLPVCNVPYNNNNCTVHTHAQERMADTGLQHYDTEA